MIFVRTFLFFSLLSLCACQQAVVQQTPSEEAKAEPIATTEPLIEKKAEPLIVKPKALAPLDNLWEVIAQEQRWNAWLEEHPQITREYNKLIKHPLHITGLSKQSELFLFYIHQELKKRNMPVELVFLPMVESAYNPLAYSPGGAAGLWQFMPRTGRHFKLHENWWYNGRQDVIASTQAALDYLESLHARFGDWYIALAAYNAGQGNVSKAIKRNRKKGLATDYWSLKLPLETRQYVPRLLAWNKLLSSTQSHYFYKVANKPYFKIVDTGSQLDLQKAAELANIKSDELFQLNPCFYRWATPPEGPHRLLVPYHAADLFAYNLSHLPKEQRLQWQRHKVKSGESLSVIAAKYNVKTKTIKTANKLKSHIIRIGQVLMIPSSGNTSVNTYHRSNQPSGKPVIYRVRAGDSFWSIAKLYGVSIKDLTRWNNLSKNSYLQPKQRLKIWPRGRS